METLTQGSRFSGRDFNTELSEHETGMLTSGPRRSALEVL
jgi:hypothetical protein